MGPKIGSFGAGVKNQIISKRFYECEGTWKKTIQARSIGNHWDCYIYPPDGRRLRSGNELFDYVASNRKFWDTFDPTIINFGYARKSQALKNLTEFLYLVRNG